MQGVFTAMKVANIARKSEYLRDNIIHLSLHGRLASFTQQNSGDQRPWLRRITEQALPVSVEAGVVRELRLLGGSRRLLGRTFPRSSRSPHLPRRRRQPQPMIGSSASSKVCESHAVRVATKFLEAPLQSSGELVG